MAFVSGPRDVQHDQDDHILDLEKGLDFLNPAQDGIAFVKKIGLNGSPVKSWKHEWTETALGVRSETVTLADGVATSLTVGDAYQYTVDDLLRIEDEIVRVTAIADATTLTIARGEADTTGAAHASKTAYKLGTARAENSTANVAVSDTATRLYNYVQTFDKTVELSTHEIAQLSTESGNPMTGQVKRRFIETTRDMAAAFFYGVRYADTTNKRYFAGGLKQFITTNATDLSGALTVAAIDGVIKAIVDAGGTPDTLVMNTTQKQNLDGLDASLVRIGKETRMGGNPITQTWQSGIMTQPLQVIVDFSVAQDEVWVLDSSMLSINKMSNNGAGHGFKLVDATTPGQDGRETRILGHYTFVVKQEKSCGYLYNVSA